MQRSVGFVGLVVVSLVAISITRADEAAGDVRESIMKASAAYADAYNARDYQALAEQWTTGAELVEGGSRAAGREAIVASIRGWLERHPEARITIDIADVQLAAPTLARVRGRIRFSRQPGAAPQESQFTCLRVLDNGTWRLAESVVAMNHAAALDDLNWLVGGWRATDPKTGTTIDAVYERALGGRVILGRIKLVPKEGEPVESLEIIHADRAAGIVRVAIHDSTGAQAQGVIEADGTSFSRSLVGTPGETAGGSRTQWVQSIVRGGPDRFTMQSLERSLDGTPLPDGQPMHFQKK